MKCKYLHDDKNVKLKLWNLCGITYEICNCSLELTNFKNDLIEYKCCNKNFQQKFDEKLKGQFLSRFQYSDHESNTCISLLRKGTYTYEYVDDWEKFSETLPWKEDFYGHLNMEDVTDAGYTHWKRFWNKNL